MSEGLYLHDAYLTRFAATVQDVPGDGVVLDRTAFYPTGGGQPSDRGRLVNATSETWTVVGVEKGPEGIVHQLEGSRRLTPGDVVEGEIDWTRRYTHMRYHTALHLLSGVVFHRFGSGITGGQFSEDGARMDFSLPEFHRSLAEELIAQTNVVAREGHPVHVRFMPREEALASPSLVRVASGLLPDAATLRLIDIDGFDVQADGGTHVRSTEEVGTLSLERIENKGAKNKRVYLKLSP